MKGRHKRRPDDEKRPSGPEKSREPAAMEAEDCRCKEPLGKSPSEMMRAMLRDLAFWKREKNGPG